jgi:hypothetical protein
VNVISLSVEIPPDHHLVLDLPDELPTGRAQVTIMSQSEISAAPVNPSREVARAKLLAAGALVTSIRAPEETVLLSPEELLRIGTLPPGSPTSDELIDEDRGKY